MAGVIPSRMTAEIDGDVVVFLIGMRVNRPWKVHLNTFGVIVQHWRS